MYLREFKTKLSPEMTEICINIVDSERKLIGTLHPFGLSLLSDAAVVQSLCEWRSKNKKMFPTQMVPTVDTTKRFLEKVILDSDSILFGIYDTEKNLIGHIGLMQRSGDCFELAHLIRGVNSGNPKIVFYTEAALLNWCFELFNPEVIEVELMSYNWIVMLLHNELGFEVSFTSPLFKVTEGDGVLHRVVSADEANVKYGISHLTLFKNDFYKKAAWFSTPNSPVKN